MKRVGSIVMILGVSYWRLLIISLFTAGIYSGNMSLERLFGFVSDTHSLPIPDVLQQIKLLALAPLFIFGLYQLRSLHERQHAFKHAQSSVTLSLIVFSFTILALEISRSQPLNNYAIAPYAILISYMLLTPIILKDERCITMFFYLTILMTAVCLLITFSMNKFSFYNLGDPAITTSFTLARFSSISIFLSLWLMHKNQSKTVTSIFWLCTTTIFVMLGTALGSRAFIVFLVPSALLLMVPLIAQRYFWLATRCLLVIVVGTLIGFSLTQSSLNRLVFHTPHDGEHTDISFNDTSHCQKELSDFLQDNNFDATDYNAQQSCTPFITIRDNDGRLRLFEFAIQNASFLFGNGLDTFRSISRDAYYKQFNVYHHPHNILLGTFHDSGIIGLSLLLITLYAALILAIRILLEHPIENSFLLGIPLYMLMASMTGGDFYDARWIFIFVFIAHLLPKRTA